MASNAQVAQGSTNQSSAKVTLRVGTRQNYSEHQVPKNALRTSMKIRRMVDDWEKNQFGPALLSIQWGGESVFPNYLHWLQFRKVQQMQDNMKSSSKSPWAYLVTCYCWGCHVIDDIYRDMVISDIIERLGTASEYHRRNFFTTFDPNFVGFLYKNTPADSPIRKLIVYALTSIATDKDWATFEGKKGWPEDFLVKMIAAAGKASKGSTANTHQKTVRFEDEEAPLTFKGKTTEETECTYHLHEKTGVFCWRELKEFGGK